MNEDKLNIDLDDGNMTEDMKEQIKKKFLTCGIGFLGKFHGRLNYKKNIRKFKIKASEGYNHLDRFNYKINLRKYYNLVTKYLNQWKKKLSVEKDKEEVLKKIKKITL